MFVYTMSLMIGTAGLPHVIMRFFTVPTVKRRALVGRLGAGLHRHPLHHGPGRGGDGAHQPACTRSRPGRWAPPTPTWSTRSAPSWFKNWEKTGLLKFDDKNKDGRIQYYGKGMDAKAAELGWAGNEMVTVDNDIMVLANPEIARLPNWVIALVAAGGIAAALSTAAGLLLAMSSAVSHDLLKGMFMPNITEKSELMAGRIAMAGAILVAGFLGLNPPGFAAQVVALAFGLAASSIFPAIMMGIFNKRMNKQGAIAGMLVGLVVTLLYIFWYKGFFFIKGTEFTDLIGGPNSFFGITPEAFGAVGAWSTSSLPSWSTR
jgi:cation/acetate symporter